MGAEVLHPVCAGRAWSWVGTGMGSQPCPGPLPSDSCPDLEDGAGGSACRLSKGALAFGSSIWAASVPSRGPVWNPPVSE